MDATTLKHALDIDAPAVAAQVAAAMKEQILAVLKRRGAVVGISGGIDSAVCAALAVKAVGRERVLGIFMPERDSSPDALRLGTMLAEALGIDTVVEDIAPSLAGSGCYSRQLEAIRTVVPEYGEGWKCKLTLPSLLGEGGDRLNVFQLTVQSPDGASQTKRLSLPAYLQMVAATNMKQRTRKMIEYYHADRLNYAVLGTPNRLEYDQGFFVKQGDGAADVKPIAHLYKTQVYALAAALGVPAEIQKRPPTTDTFSLAQTQEEFYFALPYDKMDLCLYAYNHGLSPAVVAPAVGVTPAQVERVYRDIEAKRRATRYLHMPPQLIEPVAEITRGLEEARGAAKRAMPANPAGEAQPAPLMATAVALADGGRRVEG